MLKNLKDEGFDATLYESRSWVGGLWKYSKDDSLSTAENTVFNSSKYRTAISDFPVPESMADFPPAEQLHEYLESYCDHFDLWPHIKLNSPVKTVRRQDDQWILEVGKETDSWSEAFDKVAVSCGSFIKPKQPDFKDIDKFQGKTLHAMNYHNPSQFKGKRVLVVGLHASAQDIVSSLSKYGSHVCLSHRSGVVMVSLPCNSVTLASPGQQFGSPTKDPSLAAKKDSTRASCRSGFRRRLPIYLDMRY